MPKSKSPPRGENRPPSSSYQRHATTGGNGGGGNDGSPTTRRTSQDSSFHQPRSRHDEPPNAKLMSSKSPPDMFSVASSANVNNDAGNIGKYTERANNDRGQRGGWRDAASTASSAASNASTSPSNASTSTSKLSALLSANKREANPNRRYSVSTNGTDNDTFDTRSSNYSIWSNTNDSGTYDSVSVGSESYVSYDASRSYVSRASRSYVSYVSRRIRKSNPLTMGGGSGSATDWNWGGDRLSRRYAKVILGVVALAALRLFAENSSSRIVNSQIEKEWDAKWDNQVNQLRARKLPQLGSSADAEMVVPTIEEEEEEDNGKESDWEIQLRMWKPSDEEGVEDWDPKWDPNPVSTSLAAIPTTQSGVKSKIDSLADLREKNRLEHLENWKD